MDKNLNITKQVLLCDFGHFGAIERCVLLKENRNFPVAFITFTKHEAVRAVFLRVSRDNLMPSRLGYRGNLRYVARSRSPLNHFIGSMQQWLLLVELKHTIWRCSAHTSRFHISLSYSSVTIYHILDIFFFVFCIWAGSRGIRRRKVGYTMRSAPRRGCWLHTWTLGFFSHQTNACMFCSPAVTSAGMFGWSWRAGICGCILSIATLRAFEFGYLQHLTMCDLPVLCPVPNSVCARTACKLFWQKDSLPRK